MTSYSFDAQRELAKFWWVFAVRGGSAVLFAGALAYSSSLLGTLFFDPVVLVYLSLLLGFYVLGNGVLLGVAAGFAMEHRLHVGWLLLAECIVAIALGTYIGFTLTMTAQTLAWLAALHAITAGIFQALLGLRVRRHRLQTMLLNIAAILSIAAGILFLLHRDADTRVTAHWMSLFELTEGAVVLAFAYGLHRPSNKPSTGKETEYPA